MNEFNKSLTLLCTDWILGKEQDKSKFKIFQKTLLKHSINKTVYRNWGFDAETIPDLFLNGYINIDKEVIESSFYIEDFHFSFLNDLYDKLYFYLDDIRFITKKTGKCFNIYKPLKEALNQPEKFSSEELDNISLALNKYFKQNEYLFLKPEDKIHLNEVEFFLISDNTIESFEYREESKKNHSFKIEDYYCFNKNEFIEYFKLNPFAFQELFFNIISEEHINNTEKLNKLSDNVFNKKNKKQKQKQKIII